MNIASLIIPMIFLHIVDDYYLQGILANMKQRLWWEKNAPDDMYKHDYIVALLMHSMSWSFMIMLPLIVKYGYIDTVKVLWAANASIHFLVDDLKANKRKINLITDQSIHMIQIILTAIAALSISQ